MELGEFQILVPNRQRTDTHATAETLPTAPHSSALGNWPHTFTCMANTEEAPELILTLWIAPKGLLPLLHQETGMSGAQNSLG